MVLDLLKDQPTMLTMQPSLPQAPADRAVGATGHARPREASRRWLGERILTEYGALPDATRPGRRDVVDPG